MPRSDDTLGKLPAEAFSHPLLTRLSQLTNDQLGVGFVVVFRQDDGWAQVRPGKQPIRPEFCGLIQSTKEGARHCKMCHVLMSVAAGTAGTTSQRCHAGVSVLVSPLSPGSEDGLAVLSTCIFTDDVRKNAWKETRLRGKKLGLNGDELRVAYDHLPELTGDKIALARGLMSVAGEAVKEIVKRYRLQQEYERLKTDTSTRTAIQATIEKQLREGIASKVASEDTPNDAGGGDDVPAVIQVVLNMIDSRPDMPFVVSELAAAARVTPNHLSTLFRKHAGLTFVEYLTEKRMSLAKQLLRDYTLNINEVASKSGYDDAGYFARRFRQHTGVSPREWRRS